MACTHVLPTLRQCIRVQYYYRDKYQIEWRRRGERCFFPSRRIYATIFCPHVARASAAATRTPFSIEPKYLHGRLSVVERRRKKTHFNVRFVHGKSIIEMVIYICINSVAIYSCIMSESAFDVSYIIIIHI